MKGITRTFTTLVTLCILASAAHADTFAFRDHQGKVHVYDDGQVYTLGYLSTTYKFRGGILAYRDNNRLYVASSQSGWQPLLFATAIDNYQITEETVVFNIGRQLYRISDLSDRKSAQLISNNVKSFHVFNPETDRVKP